MEKKDIKEGRKRSILKSPKSSEKMHMSNEHVKFDKVTVAEVDLPCEQ